MKLNNARFNHALFLFSLVGTSIGVYSFPTNTGKQCPLPTTGPLFGGDKQHDSTTQFAAMNKDTYFTPGSIGGLIQTMLKASKFVYKYGNIRKVVMEHDNKIRGGVPEKEGFLGRKEKPLVDFYRSDLIMTQSGSQRNNPNRYLKYPVTLAAMLEFLGNNRHLLKDSKEDNAFEFQQLATESKALPELVTERELETLSIFDGEIIDYSDKKTNKEGLVYGITINKSLKRVTVVFRGTMFKNGVKDLKSDFNFFQNAKHFAHLKKDVKIHSGFSGYLFEKIEGEDRTKYDRIVALLKDLYDNDLPKEDRDDYTVAVTGHSLGGALANLFAFTLSVREGEDDRPLFRYIKAVTFAAPVVGNSAYDKVFQEQERKKKLFLLRVSNQGDIMPTNPFPFAFDYTQNGVNMHVKEVGEEMELMYGNKKSLASQIGLSWLSHHSFPEYRSRIFQEPNTGNFNDHFEDVYESEMKN